MDKRKMTYTCLAMTVAAMLTVSCDYKDLTADQAQRDKLVPVKIDFDLSAMDSIPASYSIAFFPLEEDGAYAQENMYRRFDILPRQTTVTIKEGTYALTAWNNDTEHVTYDNRKERDSFYASTYDLFARPESTPPNVLDSLFAGQRVLDYPDYMTHAGIDSVRVTRSAKDTLTLTLRPVPMTVNVHYRIGGVRGLGWCSRVKGALNNVWGKRYIAYEDRCEEPVSVLFECDYSEEQECVYGDMTIFSLADLKDSGSMERDKMVLFFWLPTTSCYIPIDITEALEPYRNKVVKDIYIEIDDLDIDLTDYLEKAGGFVIDIEEWSDVNIDIRL